MGDVVDLSIGPPSTPEVAAGVGDPTPTTPKAKRTPRSSNSTPSSSPASEPPPTGFDMLDEPLPAVTMDQVKVVVMSAGMMLSMAFADDDVDGQWRFTEVELAALVPPLTSIINRRPALRKAVQRGDEFTVALVLAGYTGRNLDTLRAARKARAQRESEVDGADRQGEAPRASGTSGAGNAQPGWGPAGRPTARGVPGPPG